MSNVNTEALTGLFAIAGALAGGAGTVFVQVLADRSANKRANLQYKQQRDDFKSSQRITQEKSDQEACRVFLRKAYAFLDRARHVEGAVDDKADETELQDRVSLYERAWRELAECTVEAELAFGGVLDSSVLKLRAALADYGNLIDGRLAGSRWPAGVPEVKAAIDEARKNLVRELSSRSTTFSE